MTVSLELFEAVSVTETTGNTFCLSHSLIVHMAFNEHGVQSETHTYYQYMKSVFKLLKKADNLCLVYF